MKNEVCSVKELRYLETVLVKLKDIRSGVNDSSIKIDEINEYLVGGYPEPNIELCARKESMNQTEKIDEVLDEIRDGLNILYSRIDKLNNSI